MFSCPSSLPLIACLLLHCYSRPCLSGAKFLWVCFENVRQNKLLFTFACLELLGTGFHVSPSSLAGSRQSNTAIAWRALLTTNCTAHLLSYRLCSGGHLTSTTECVCRPSSQSSERSSVTSNGQNGSRWFRSGPLLSKRTMSIDLGVIGIKL